MATYQITKHEKEKLEKEIEQLIHVRRPEVIERIKLARGFGDLSENSEYDAAKDDQAFIEARISELEDILQKAEIISDNVDTSEVSIGNVVTYENLTDNVQQKFQIVGVGANVLEGTISSETPVAQALLGHIAGEKVVVDTAAGRKELHILTIE